MTPPTVPPRGQNATAPRPIRVLQAHSGNLFGGVETFLLTWWRHRDDCPRLALEFSVCFEGHFRQELTRAGTVPHLLTSPRFRWPPSLWKARRDFRQLLRATQPAVVVCHSPWALALFGPVLRATSHRTVFWVHDLFDGRPWLERLARRSAPDLVVHNSRFSEASAIALFPATPRALVYCPVPAPPPLPEDQRLRVRAELQTPAEAVVVIQVGRLEPYKGHAHLLAALARQRDPRVWLWVAGGPQRPQEQRYLDALRQQAATAGLLERTRFLGSRKDVPQLLAAADVFCQPNLAPETFGLVFIEALYARLPVITTRLGGGAEIVTDQCGVCVPPHDLPALAAALDALVHTPSQRRQLGNAGPARATQLCDPARRLADIQQLLLDSAAP